MHTELIVRWKDDNREKTNNFNEFENGAWIYDVGSGTDDIHSNEDRVDFTYSGDIFDIPIGKEEEDGINYWPTEDVNGVKIRLPWHSGKSWAMEDPNTGTLISSTELT